jgi:hypothetical protein
MRRYVVLGLVVAGVVRCNGTETDNPATDPLVPFEGSECKKYSEGEGAVPIENDGSALGQSRAALSLASARGLMCWDWSFDEGGNLTVQILNLLEGCGYEWKGGRARVKENDVFLEAINHGCFASACGSCTYDVRFEVHGAPRSGDVTLHLSITDEAAKNCKPGDAANTDKVVTIPAGERVGTRCEFLPNFAYQPPETCALHMECGDALPCTCPAGEQCAAVGLPTYAGASRCVAECATNADCPIPAAFECVGGLCRLRE